MAEVEKRKVYNLRGEETVDLKEMQIKLERIRAYVKRAEGRLNGNELTLQRLRDKQIEIENKRQRTAVLTRGKHDKKI